EARINGLPAVPGGGDKKERDNKEQAFLMNQLGGVVKQGLRKLKTEPALDPSMDAFFHQQPTPAGQDHDRDNLRQLLFALDQEKTRQPGYKPKYRNRPGETVGKRYDFWRGITEKFKHRLGTIRPYPCKDTQDHALVQPALKARRVKSRP